MLPAALPLPSATEPPSAADLPASIRANAVAGRVHRPRRVHAPLGFTLIELMVTIAILGILTMIALPIYRTHVVRGKLVAGTNALASMRAQMEQYYQDNRTYQTVSTSITAPCLTSTTADTFTISCAANTTAGTTAPTATTYTITATGSGLTSGTLYTVNQLNAQTTLGLPSGWTVPTSNACWIMRKGDSC